MLFHDIDLDRGHHNVVAACLRAIEHLIIQCDLILEENKLGIHLATDLGADSGLRHGGITVYPFIYNDQATPESTSDDKTPFAYAGEYSIAERTVKEFLDAGALALIARMAFWTSSSILSDVSGSNAITLPPKKISANKVIYVVAFRIFLSGAEDRRIKAISPVIHRY